MDINEGDLVTIHARVVAKKQNGQCVIEVFDLAPGSDKPLLIANEQGLCPQRTHEEVEARGKEVREEP